jgi:hypothetical protein
MVSRFFMLDMEYTYPGGAGTIDSGWTMDGGSGQPPQTLDGGSGQPPQTLDGGSGQPPTHL